jgi:hypothetical protein
MNSSEYVDSWLINTLFFLFRSAKCCWPRGQDIDNTMKSYQMYLLVILGRMRGSTAGDIERSIKIRCMRFYDSRTNSHVSTSSDLSPTNACIPRRSAL